MTASDDPSVQRPGDNSLLPRHLCRVMGVNQNYSSRSGTSYHVQIEDRGPVFDDALEEWVRRVNVIAYANYGEATARIVHGRDHDLPDIRTHSHNRVVVRRIQELASEAIVLLEEREARQITRIRDLLRRYYDTRAEDAKREIEEANALYPFVFARAFQELKSERARQAEAAAAEAAVAEAAVAAKQTELPPLSMPPLEIEEVEYPLDPALRDLVLEIERVAEDLQRDVATLKTRGAADDIMQASCAKLVSRAKESLTRRHGTEYASRHLEMTRNSLVTAYRQVRAKLTRMNEA
jgi:hypothetical protein